MLNIYAMQKILLAFSLFLTSLVFGFTANATHFMGGELWITKMPDGSPTTHKVNMVLYRDNVGILFNNSEEVFYTQSNQLKLKTMVTLDSANFQGLSNTGQARIEARYYSSSVNLIPNYVYNFFFTGCCRNLCISNIPASEGNIFYINTMYLNSAMPAGFPFP